MHQVEQLTWNLLRQIMLQTDPGHEGWAIDAGLGHFDYYCEWFKALGYPTVAIEAYPEPQAVAVCESAGIPLVHAALHSSVGKAQLFHAPERDLRSLEGEMWGGMSPMKEVETVTLQSIIDQYAIEKIAALKLDIEGSEPHALSVLPSLPLSALPNVISLEWGGEHPKSTERGLWNNTHQKIMKTTFRMLKKLGYKRGLLIGSGDSLILRPFRYGLPIFKDADNWGNAILTRFDILPETMIGYADTSI